MPHQGPQAQHGPILTEDPPDPRPPANPKIDPSLATILETSTAKERNLRYQTSLDLAEDLT